MFYRATKHFARALLVLAALFCLNAAPVAADTIIFESATLGPTNQESGTFVDGEQYLGARFQVSSASRITAVGGHLGSFTPGGSFFAAIVGLSDAAAFPAGNPSDFAPLAVRQFVAPFPSVEVLTDFDLTIGPGDYALIFGGGRFGATGSGFMADTNDLLSENNFFSSGDRWLNDPLVGTRFVVVGEPAAPVPEPATMILLGTGLTALAGAARRQRRPRRAGR